MQEAILETLGTLQRCIQLISIPDLIDMGIIAYVIYRGMKLLKDTSAMRLAKGILIIFAAQIVAESLQLNTVYVDLTAGLLIRCIVPRRLSFSPNCAYAGTAR